MKEEEENGEKEGKEKEGEEDDESLNSEEEELLNNLNDQLNGLEVQTESLCETMALQSHIASKLESLEEKL